MVRKLFPIFRFISFFTLIFGGYTYQLANGWLFLGRQPIDFGDLKYVLDRADCSRDIGRLVFADYQLDPVCNDFIYGYPLLKFFEFFNVRSQDYVTYGIVSMLLFSIVAAFFIANLTKLSQKFLVFTCLFSPPIILLIERANIDTFICLLIILSIFLLKHNFSYLAITVISIISSFKFYPSSLVLYYIFFVKNNWKRVTLIPIFALVLASIIYDLLNISKLPWDARNMFGNIIWGEYFVYLIDGKNSHANYVLGTGIGILLLALPIFIIFRSQRIMDQLKFKANSDDLFWYKNLFYINGIVFFSCYFIGLSVDYRLIYLAAPILCAIELCKFTSAFKGCVVALLIFSLFASYNVGVFQVFGDMAILLLTAILFLIFIKNFASLKSYLAMNEKF